MHQFKLDHTHYYTMEEMNQLHSHYMEMRDLEARPNLDEFARARIRPELEQWLNSTGFAYQIRYIWEGSRENLATYIVVQFDAPDPAVLFKLAWGG